MQDEQGQPIVQPVTRRGFFANAIAAVLAFLGLGADETPAPSVPVSRKSATLPTFSVMDRLPGSVEELMRLSDEQKVMLAAATASGCDAVAYYRADGGGRFIADQVIQMYPPAHYRESGAQPQFAATLAGYDPHTHRDAQQVMAHKQYHIPVPIHDASGNPTATIQGVLVLHAPQESFGKIQDSVTDNKNDLHEPVACRLAKLKMAEDIIAEHQDLFGATGSLLKQREDRHKTTASKLAYFKTLIADSYATLGEGGEQRAHADGVTQLMDLAVEKILGSKVSPQQAELIHDLAELHDIGKSQMSSAFMRPWKQASTPEVQRYFFEQNHNHPLFTLLELLLYSDDAKMTAAHHHGVFRYGSEELKHALGEDFEKYTILKDNLKPEEISPLSYLMRLSDVGDAMTGRGQKPLAVAVQELADKVQMREGKPVIGPGTIHPDYLCLMIKNGVFDAYARNTQPEKLRAVENQVLEKFGWTGEAAAQKEAALMAALANDPLLKDPANRAPQMAR